MKSKFLLLNILTMISAFSVIGQVEKRIYYSDADLVPIEHPMDFEHLKLEVSFIPEQGKVIGKVVHSFKVLAWEVDTVFLHAEHISITAAKLDEQEVTFRKSQGGFVFDFNKMLKAESKHTLQIEYTSKPKKGIYFIGWNDSSNRSRKQIWTQGQGRDNRQWIPMYDLPNDKVTSEIIVQMKDEYKVLSNGALKGSKKDKAGNRLWHYAMENPHATYLIMLGIGDYEIKTTKSESGVIMNFYYYPDWADRVNPTYKYSEDMMSFMEEETGVLYPWASYSQIPVQNFLYGAMENTSATIFGDFYFVDERSYLDKNYVRVNAHELAHQWFGDYVTARTSAHHWLQESFATHYDLIYQGIAFGEDHFNWARRNAAKSAIEASKKDFKPLAHSAAGTARHYPKGSYVLQMLRDVAGNDNYKRAIKYYLNKHAFKNVDSEDLLIAFHESTGLSLDWFWEQWIYKGGEPSYEVNFEELQTDEARIGRFKVEQIQTINELTGLFKMPIEFEVFLKNGSSVNRTVVIENQTQIVDLKLPKDVQVEYALFDVGSKVMKTVRFDKSYSMLASQAHNAKHMLDRYDAVEAMTSMSLDIKREELHNIYKKEKFHAVKSSVLRQLFHDPESRELVRGALYDKDVEVRRTVINLATVIHPGLHGDMEKLLTDSSYQIVMKALDRLCAQYPQNTKRYLDITKNVEGTLERNVRIKWLEIAYHYTGDEVHLNTLKDYTSASFEFRTRVNAAKKFKTINYLDVDLLHNMLDGVFSGNPRLRGPMKELIQYFAQQTDYRNLIESEIIKGDWTNFQKRRIDSMKL